MNEHGCEFEAFEPDEGRCNAPATKLNLSRPAAARIGS